VQLRDLARLAGISHPASVLVDSLEEGGTFRHAVLSAGQIMDRTRCSRCGSTARTCPWTTDIPPA